MNCVASGAALPLLYQPQWYTTLLLSDALSGTAADRSYPACTFPENAEVRRVTRRQEPEHAILSAIAIALQASDHYDSDLPARAALRSSSNADRLAFAPECPRSMNSLGAVHPRSSSKTERVQLRRAILIGGRCSDVESMWHLVASTQAA